MPGKATRQRKREIRSDFSVLASTRKVKSAPPWLRFLILTLSMLLMISWLSRSTADADLWWHLKTGEFVWTQHKLPVPDPFGWTTYFGEPFYPGEEINRYFNLTHEWLAQITLYLAYAVGGLSGLALMRAISLTLFCGLAGLMAYRRTLSLHRAMGAALAVAIVMHSFPEDRPQYFTYVFVALTLNILDSGRKFWLLPPLFLIWANCHGGFFLGWVVVGIYCAEDLYARWRNKSTTVKPALWVAGLFAIVVSGLNPNGFRVFEVLLNYRNSPLQSQIIEWYRPNFLELSPFTILLYGALLVLLLKRREARVADWLLLAAFGSAGLLAWRNIGFTAWVGAFLISVYLPWRTAQRNRRVIIEFAVAGVLMIVTVIGAIQGWLLRFHEAIKTPVAPAADFLMQHHIHGRLFNTYAEGGYLIWRLWPELQVFADGRALNESVALDTQRIILAADNTGGKSSEDLLKQYGIDIILMHAFEPLSGAAYYLPAALADPQQMEWKLIYRDAQQLIYMRRPPPDVQILNQLDGLVGMEEQCTSLINAGASACSRGMVDVFSRIGDEERAYKWDQVRQSHNIE